MNQSRNPYNRWFRRIKTSHAMSRSDIVKCCRIGGAEISPSTADAWARRQSSAGAHHVASMKQAQRADRAEFERDTARAETAMAVELAFNAGADWALVRYRCHWEDVLAALTPANAKAALAARDKATRKQALREAADLPPYDWDGDPASTFENYVFVKRDNIIALMGK